MSIDAFGTNNGGFHLHLFFFLLSTSFMIKLPLSLLTTLRPICKGKTVDETPPIAIGTSADRHKILGVYLSFLMDLCVSSNRGTVTTLALLLDHDVQEFGLSFCLQETLLELEDLVTNGYFDEKSQTQIQVRIIASLGKY